MKTTTRAAETTRARLTELCARLYDAATPERERRDLSLEVSMLRAELAGCRDPLAAMTRASESDDECEGA